jgi:hypothetical protein
MEEIRMANSTTPTADAVEQKVVALAEQVGRLIGTVQAKAEGWMDGRSLEDQLTSIRESAGDLLAQIKGAKPSQAAPTRKTRGRSGGVVDAPGKKHRGPMPSIRGVKHSDERIAKSRLPKTGRRAQRRG